VNGRGDQRSDHGTAILRMLKLWSKGSIPERLSSKDLLANGLDITLLVPDEPISKLRPSFSESAHPLGNAASETSL
jgi:hypothetical protein